MRGRESMKKEEGRYREMRGRESLKKERKNFVVENLLKNFESLMVSLKTW